MVDKIAAPDGQPVAVPANVAPVYIPTPDMLHPETYGVNVPNVMEALTYPLYSALTYTATGPTAPLVFFQQAPGVAGSTQTAEDTNMQLGGQLPAPQSYLVQGIGIELYSGLAASRFGAQSANSILNDYWAVMKRGVIVLTIGSKDYLQVGPLIQLPPRSHVNGAAAVTDATTAGANLQTMVTVGFSDGPVFNPRPLLIPPSQNFKVTVSFPSTSPGPALPSGDTNTRIMCTLYGTLYRPAQ